MSLYKFFSKKIEKEVWISGFFFKDKIKQKKKVLNEGLNDWF